MWHIQINALPNGVCTVAKIRTRRHMWKRAPTKGTGPNSPAPLVQWILFPALKILLWMHMYFHIANVHVGVAAVAVAAGRVLFYHLCWLLIFILMTYSGKTPSPCTFLIIRSSKSGILMIIRLPFLGYWKWQNVSIYRLDFICSLACENTSVYPTPKEYMHMTLEC